MPLAVLKEALESTSIFPSAWLSESKQLYFTEAVVPFQQFWIF